MTVFLIMLLCFRELETAHLYFQELHQTAHQVIVTESQHFLMSQRRLVESGSARSYGEALRSWASSLGQVEDNVHKRLDKNLVK